MRECDAEVKANTKDFNRDMIRGNKRDVSDDKEKNVYDDYKENVKEDVYRKFYARKCDNANRNAKDANEKGGLDE